MCVALVRKEFPSYHLMDPRAFEPLRCKLKQLFEQGEDYEDFIDEFNTVLAEQERYPEVMTILKETLSGDGKARERLIQHTSHA